MVPQWFIGDDTKPCTFDVGSVHTFPGHSVLLIGIPVSNVLLEGGVDLEALAGLVAGQADQAAQTAVYQRGREARRAVRPERDDVGPVTP